jgi:hypothetical protein
MDVIELWEDTVERGEVLLERAPNDPIAAMPSYYADEQGAILVNVRVTKETSPMDTVTKVLLVRA